MPTFDFYKIARNFRTKRRPGCVSKNVYKLFPQMADDDEFTLYEPVLSILSGGGRERHSPARPGVLYGRVALGSAGQGKAAALQHAVLLVPGRKPGRTCVKIVHFNRGSRQCSPSARSASGSGPQTVPDLCKYSPF